MTLEEAIKQADALAQGLRGMLPVVPPVVAPSETDVQAVARYLADKKLTLPINAQGQPYGNAAEIDPKDLLTLSSPFFKIVGREINIICPPKGATTKTAKYPRTELRYLKEFSIDEPFEDTIRLSVDILAEGQKVVIHQIHDEEEPWVKVVADLKEGFIRVRALIKVKDGASSDTTKIMKVGHALRTPFDSTLMWKPKTKELVCVLDGAKVETKMNRTGAGGKAYGKSGAYVQGGTYGVKLRHYV